MSIVDGTSILINPIETLDSRWMWFGLKISGVNGKTPHIVVDATNRLEGFSANENMILWGEAIDSTVWNKFDNKSLNGNLTVYNNSPFAVDDIYITAQPDYPVSRTARLMAMWLADSHVNDTPSSTNGIIGISTSRDSNDGTGRIVPALPFYAFKLTNPSGFTKNKMILSSGNHPNEPEGRWQLEGALDWLLGGSAEAETLLDWFEVYVYPCTNPQGIWAGYTRSQPEDPTLDHNRTWDTGGLECIDAFETAMIADTGGSIEVGIDFHSGEARPGYCITEDKTAALYADFITQMQTYDILFAGYDLSVSGFLPYWWNHGMTVCRMGLTVERESVATAEIPTAAKTQGANVLKSIYVLLLDGLWTNHP